MEVLNNVDGEDVMIKLSDPSRAGVIYPVEQSENESVLMLLMPMMLND
jgi:DNA polymerase-3 subunit beta